MIEQRPVSAGRDPSTDNIRTARKLLTLQCSADVGPFLLHRETGAERPPIKKRLSLANCEPAWQPSGNATTWFWDSKYNQTRMCYPKYLEEWKSGSMVPPETEFGREFLQTPLTLEEVEFAFMLFWHRHYPGPGMVPVLDMLNTDEDPTVQQITFNLVGVDEFGSSEKGYCMRASRALKRGEEVTALYGQRVQLEKVFLGIWS